MASSKDNEILYLEFGVWKGKSIDFASKNNNNPNSLFFGFDSFYGLPENWTKTHPKGRLNVDGNIPDIDDSRVTFVKGLFNDTLDDFLPKLENLINQNPHRQLIINMDADLFSSTAYVLTKLEKMIVSGTIIRFDEFGETSENSEFLAFRNFVRTYEKTFEILIADNWYRHVTLQIN